MTEAAQTKPIDVPSLGISMSVNLSKDHAITMQSFVSRDDDDPRTLIDKMARQADRLIARYRLKDLRKQLSMNQMQLKNMIGDLARIDAAHVSEFENSGRRGDFRRSPKQEGERNNALVTRERFEQVITDLVSQIAETEKEAE